MNKKLTIGIFCDSFYPIRDGVVSVVNNYATILSEIANVVVFVPKYINTSFDDSVFPYKVVRCYSVKVPFLDYSLPTPILDLKFKKELKKYNLDIVHIHSPFTLGKIGLYYAKKHNVPCIGPMHSQFKQDFYRATKSEKLSTKLTKQIIKVFNKCDECWAVNEEVARIYYEEYKYKCLPRVMNNATEMIPVSDTKKANKHINKKHDIKRHEKVLLFVGRINILKNILFIADSIKAVKVKRPKLKFKMLFVGSGQDEDKLIQKISELGLEKDIIMCGKITDREELAYYYNRAYLFLFPSVYDASSIVQIEAASQATPGLFLEGTATASTVTNNVNGFISEYTIGAYSDRIIEILENKTLYEKVARNAYIDLYKTWDDVVLQAYHIYIEKIKLKKEF